MSYRAVGLVLRLRDSPLLFGGVRVVVRDRRGDLQRARQRARLVVQAILLRSDIR